MTEKQRRFADHYIASGNAAEAARLAGYAPRNARQTGSENLTKPYIAEYIREQLESMADSRLADAREVMAVFSDIMRDSEGTSPHDRIEAGRAILRRIERLEDRQTENELLAEAKKVLFTIDSTIQ